MKNLISLCLLIILYTPTLFASPYMVGDKLVVLSLTNQHEKPGEVNEATQIILFSRDKSGGGLINKALSKTSPETLAEKHIVFISDISGMPGLISKYMAIPSMRKKSYPILLDRDGSITADFPDQNKAATLIYLDSLEIRNIVHLNSKDKIRQSLGLE